MLTLNGLLCTLGKLLTVLLLFLAQLVAGLFALPTASITTAIGAINAAPCPV